MAKKKDRREDDVTNPADISRVPYPPGIKPIRAPKQAPKTVKRGPRKPAK